MRVSKLHLRNFRNAPLLDLIPSAGLNFILGANGRGKTSVLEGLGFLASLRSFRGAKTAEVIAWGQTDAEVRATLRLDGNDTVADALTTQLQVVFQQNPVSGRGAKLALINGKPFRSTTAFLSQRFGQMELGVHAIVFNPADHDLVRGEPALRRNLLDRALAAQDQKYLEWLGHYTKTLEQRNALLKQEQGVTREQLLSFTEPLIYWGTRITLRRLQWLARANTSVTKNANKIAPLQALLSLQFTSSWAQKYDGLSFKNKDLGAIHFSGQSHDATLQELEQSFWKRLRAVEAAERSFGNTLVGPHRDDWGFVMGNQSLRGHGSQGEVRTALLALKLTELELFREATRHRPLFLLDDFSSELDRSRRQFLLNFLADSDLQVFITATEEPLDAASLGRCFWLGEGNDGGYGNQSGKNALFPESSQRSTEDERLITDCSN